MFGAAPLRRQYMLAGGLLSLVITVAFAAFYLTELRQLNRQFEAVSQAGAERAGMRAMERNISVLAASLSESLTVPLYRLDFDAALETLEAVRRGHDVEFVYVLDADGRVFHDGTVTVETFGEPAQAVLPAGCDTGLWTALAASRLFCAGHAITVGGQVVGQVYVGVADASVASDVQFAARQGREALEQSWRQQVIRLGLVFLAGTLLTLWLTRRLVAVLVRPIETLVEAARGVTRGDAGSQFELDRSDEFGELARTLQAMTTSLRAGQQALERSANEDALTRIPNRQCFEREVGELIKQCSHAQRSFALLYLDLDKFKEINDGFGHGAGDVVLRTVADRLNTCLGPLTLGDCGQCSVDVKQVFRIGGDEFVLTVEVTDASDTQTNPCIAASAQRIIDRLTAPMGLETGQQEIGASIGVAMFPRDGRTIQDLMRCADMAMYVAKAQPNGAYSFYDEAFAREADRRMRLRRELDLALRSDALALVYQPILDARSSRVIGCEVLSRWPRPDQEPVPPGVFVGIASSYHLIHGLTGWMLGRVDRDLARMTRRRLKRLGMSLNIPLAEVDLEDTLTQVESLRRKGALANRRVVIEVTESALLQDSAEVKEAMHRLRDAGCEIWLDDFGTGYSALSYLHRFQFDGIKIDRQFVRDLALTSAARKLVRAIIQMAKALDIRTVAEGVETDAQRRILAEYGCDYLQGFLFSPGVSPQDLPRVIAEIERGDSEVPHTESVMRASSL